MAGEELTQVVPSWASASWAWVCRWAARHRVASIRQEYNPEAGEQERAAYISQAARLSVSAHLEDYTHPEAVPWAPAMAR